MRNTLKAIELKKLMKTLTCATNLLILAATALTLQHVPFSPARSREEPGTTSREFLRGDANDDGRADISDAVFVLGFLFLSADAPPCRSAADSNDDGKLDISDAVSLLGFLFLGDPQPPAPFPEQGIDPTPDLGCREPPLPPLPEVGSPGGPDRELTEAEAISWRRGLQLFDRPTTLAQGLGPAFNADSCRGCHIDPAVGGAGGLDLNVIRFAHSDESGTLTQLPGGPAASRFSNPGLLREECPEGVNVMETRQTPSSLGLGLVDRVPDEAILANADPADANGDGISGRARMVGGRVGRFGHKAGVPSLRDFAADALFNEVGITIRGDLSPFATASDTDGAADPEMSEPEFLDLVFFMAHLAPPQRRAPRDPAEAQRVSEGEALFDAIGCDSCHAPSLQGADGPVRAYSDFLLHDVADPARRQVDESGVDPREFRTAPLWGIRDTAPYLHDGSAESIADAVFQGHFGEAQATRQAFEALSTEEKAKVVEFLMSL
ncbi:MAG: c-type cytochrome [Planctomycetes bacterium]|nr:c-type cytochrome [Planctomycetota bacterium]